MLAADTTFIDELFPIIGMCTVISDNDNKGSLIPAFSEPKIRQTGFCLLNTALNSSELMSTLDELISSAMMIAPDRFKEVTRASAS